MAAIRVVFFQENVPNSGEWWVAQCVEYDIAAQARSMVDVRYELERMLVTHISASVRHGIKALENLPKAPPLFAAMFDAAQFSLNPIGDLPNFATLNEAAPNREYRVAA